MQLYLVQANGPGYRHHTLNDAAFALLEVYKPVFCFLFSFFFLVLIFFFYNSFHILLESAATYIQAYTVMHRLVRFKFGFLCGKKKGKSSPETKSTIFPPGATNIVKYTSV